MERGLSPFAPVIGMTKPLLEQTSLEENRVSKPYRADLAKGWKLFLAWVIFSAISVEWENLSKTEFDKMLVTFVNQCHQAGVKFQRVKMAVLAAQFHFPYLRKRLPRAWAAMHSWKLQLPWKSRVPFTKQVLEYLFLLALNHMSLAPTMQSAAQWLSIALMLRLCFFCLLRPGEVRRLRKSDISITTCGLDKPSLVCAVENAKTSSIPGAGRAQFGITSDPCTVAWVESALFGVAQATQLWGQGAALMRSRLLTILCEAHLQGPGFTWASGRAGGTTFMFMMGWSIEQIQFRGRWLSQRTLHSYVQEGAAMLTWSSISPSAALEAQALISKYPKLLQGPPKAPWYVLCSRNR